ncbi:MAG: hypothetical protein R3F39_11090 [Myxococcota bacterium]
MIARSLRLAVLPILIGAFGLLATSTALAASSQDGDKAAAHEKLPELAARADALVAGFEAVASDMEKQRDGGACRACNNLRGQATNAAAFFAGIYSEIVKPDPSEKPYKRYRSELQRASRTFGMMLKGSGVTDEAAVAAAWQKLDDEASSLVDAVEALRAAK